MRKLIVGAQVSLDGVMQAPGGPAEDPTNGFRFGGWAMPYGDETSWAELMRLFENFDLLLGRKTYEIFAGYWPYQDVAAPHGAVVKAFNRVRKYVVSGSGNVDTGWTGTVLLRDLDAVERLRREDGPTLLTQGSTALVHALLARDLVDAMSLFTMPVVLGGGKKLFADGSAPHAFTLTRSLVSSDGMIVGHYERNGAVKIGDASPDAPSPREIARRARLKREG